MLSRVANSIYWMSRYLERADNVARFLNVNTQLLLDMGPEAATAQWQPMIATTGDEADFTARHGSASEKNVIRFLIFDEENRNSILSCVSAARENARTVREAIPSDLWETINALYHLVKMQGESAAADLQEFYSQIRISHHLFTGLLENAMSHNEAWHFARMGRLLERADKTARMLDVKYFLLLPNSEFVDSPYDAVQWGAVLKSANAFEMYRKQYHRISYKDVAHFLIFDTLFPRSMLHCVQSAEASLRAISASAQVDTPARAEMATLRQMLATTTVETVLANGLHEFIDVFQFNLNVVDQRIFQSFFALHAEPGAQT